MFAHQKKSVALLAKRPRAFDTSDPGTGKTRVQLEAYQNDTKRKKALVICPKSLCESAWGKDIEEFTPRLRYVIAPAGKRRAAFDQDVDIYITNTDAVAELVNFPDSVWKRFDTLIIDESTAFKHNTSKRSKAVYKLAKHFSKRRLMTGTPTSNGLPDIWHQMMIVDDGAHLGKSFFAFRAAVCQAKQIGPMPNMVRWEDRPGAEARVAGLLAEVIIRNKFEECVDIPANFMYSVPFTLSKKHMATYQDMSIMATTQLKKQTVTAVNGAVLYTKLLQIASGAVYDDSGSYSSIASERYNLVMDLVEAREHSIVFFTWEHQRNELIKHAKSRGISYAVFDGSTSDKDRTRIVKEYQEGKYQVLLAHPQSAGHGLTLTRGTATIWASPTYNLEHFLQGLKRVHRIGQTEKTETIVVVAEGTVDVKVWESLQAKSVRMTDLLESLKEAA